MKKGLDYKRAHINIILSIVGIICIFLAVVIGSLVLSETIKSAVPAEESSVDTTTASHEAVVSTAIYHPTSDTDIELLKCKTAEEESSDTSSDSVDESSIVTEEESSDTSSDSVDESSIVTEEETFSEESDTYEAIAPVSVYSEEVEEAIPEIEEQAVLNEEEIVEEPVVEESEPDDTTSSGKGTWYTDEDLYYLTCAIVGESQNTSFEEQIAVASVVINRLNSEWFDYTSIKEVCTAPGQYTSFSNGMAYREPTEENIAAAKYVLEHGSQLPGDCIFQSLHQQGNGVYKYFADTGTYICYK